MKSLKILLVFVLALNFLSCEVVQEVNFNADKSGLYSLGFDLSEMMSMGMGSESDSQKEQIDTLIVFADFIELKKDSIATLSLEEQMKINELKAFSVYLNSDTITNKFEMKINYQFKDLEDLALFGEKLKDQNIKELDLFGDKMNTTEKTEDENGESDSSSDMFNLNDSFITTLDEHKFTLKISPEALAKAEKEKDPAMADNPMMDLIRFKLRYTFPYRIKKVSNENAKILSDFKGIEISANMGQMNNDPKFFDTEIEFEKD